MFWSTFAFSSPLPPLLLFYPFYRLPLKPLCRFTDSQSSHSCSQTWHTSPFSTLLANMTLTPIDECG